MAVLVEDVDVDLTRNSMFGFQVCLSREISVRLSDTFGLWRRCDYAEPIASGKKIHECALYYFLIIVIAAWQ